MDLLTHRYYFEIIVHDLDTWFGRYNPWYNFDRDITSDKKGKLCEENKNLIKTLWNDEELQEKYQQSVKSGVKNSKTEFTDLNSIQFQRKVEFEEDYPSDEEYDERRGFVSLEQKKFSKLALAELHKMEDDDNEEDVQESKPKANIDQLNTTIRGMFREVFKRQLRFDQGRNDFANMIEELSDSDTE